MKKLYYAVLVLLMSICMFFGTAPQADAAEVIAIVKPSVLNLREKPTTSSRIIMKLTKGQEIIIDTQNYNGWNKARKDGKVGYVASEYIELKYSNVQGKDAWVNVSSLNVRSGRGTNYKKVTSLVKGTKVKVLDTVNGWSKITYSTNKIGYVASQYLSFKEVKDVLTDEVITSTLNVRASSYSTAKKLGTLKKGDKVSVVGSSKGWYKIKYKNGYGYVSASYVKRKGDSDYVITVNTSTNKLRYEYKGTLIKQFDVATGKASTPTPLGITTVYNKIVNRPYYKHNIPGGSPRNPLGDRWIGININGTKGQVYAIHGNNDESSIGKHISGGCIRMHNTEVRWLYSRVSIGTKVVLQK